MKKAVYGIAGILVVGIAYYLVSPLFRNIELDEPLPVVPKHPAVQDALDTMDAATMADFERQVLAMSDEVMEKEEAMPAQVGVIAQGTMVARAHEVEGRAALIQAPDGTYLRFEDLETINGPDLRIYLSADLSNKDFIDLGPIRATKGNVNYEIPAGTDLAKYRVAMIWCRAFSVLFSYAELK